MSTRKTDLDIRREDIAHGLNAAGNRVKVEPSRQGYRVVVEGLNERSMRRLVKVLRAMLDGDF